MGTESWEGIFYKILYRILRDRIQDLGTESWEGILYRILYKILRDRILSLGTESKTWGQNPGKESSIGYYIRYSGTES
jgi:hypothetical protein